MSGSHFQAWLAAVTNAAESKDRTSLAGLFAQDAKLVEGPFEPPVSGAEAICDRISSSWEYRKRSELHIEKITDGWAHWTEGGSITALDEPYRIDAIFHAELNEQGLCTRLTFWTETLSARESDMMQQRDA